MEDKRKSFFKKKIESWTKEYGGTTKRPVKRKLINDFKEYDENNHKNVAPDKVLSFANIQSASTTINNQISCHPPLEDLRLLTTIDVFPEMYEPVLKSCDLNSETLGDEEHTSSKQFVTLKNVSPKNILPSANVAPMVITAEVHIAPPEKKCQLLKEIHVPENLLAEVNTMSSIEDFIGADDEVLDENFERELRHNYYRALHEDIHEIEKNELKGKNNTDEDMDEITVEEVDNRGSNDITTERKTDENKHGKKKDKKKPKVSKNKKRKSWLRKAKLNKNYLDFLPENQDPFEYESSSWDGSATIDSSSSEKIKNDDGLVGDRAFKKKKINKRNVNKELRDKGLKHQKSNGSQCAKREIKPNPCIAKKCGNNCQIIDEERRNRIFEHYWSLPPQRQRDWLVTMTKICTIKRKRSKDSGRRTQTIEYYINDNEDRRRVCQQFLLNTLDVKQSFVQYTLNNSTSGSSKTDMRGKTVPPNKTDLSTLQNVKNFIQKLPAVPSHLSRRDSSKLYVPTEIRSKKNLYRIYKEEKTKDGVDTVSEKVFMQIFDNEYNIGIHVPKKDKCTKCIKYDNEKTEENEKLKEEHLKEKDASKGRFQFHREMGNGHPEMLCVSFDLQKVLNTPYGESMLLYYSRKLAVYNECFYENNTREGCCFVWTESNGKRGANEIATILQKYIDMVDSRGTVKYLILYSDSCPGQNKNRTVLAALHESLSRSQNLESIQMNYLLPGHTEMSVDSMHSVIESSVKNTIVWAPSQWTTVCQLSRKEPKPYQVKYLQYNDFKGYDEFADKYFKGNLHGKISKIRIATFQKICLNVMEVKYSMQDGAPEEKIYITGKPNTLINLQIYDTELPIAKKKYKDLKKLCETGTIPRLFTNEYLNLSYSGAVRDELNETDIED